jgi:hypothetical protein
VGRQGRQHQQRDGGRGLHTRLLLLRLAAYRAAWVYMCAWIAAVSLGRLPHPLGVVSVSLAVAAVLLIAVVLLEPRPTRAPVGSARPGNG